jgi:adenylylsulfate kinase
MNSLGMKILEELPRYVTPSISILPLRTFVKVSKLFADASCIAITAFISPYRVDRDFARKLHDMASIPFIEVFIDAPLEVVEARDPKGLYRKARAGEIKGWYAVTRNMKRS